MFPVWGSWYQWEGEEKGESGEKVWKGEHSANTLYMCISGKMISTETIPE
jgi:hypothetical protein